MILEFFLSIFAVNLILILLGKHIDVTIGYIGGAFMFLLGLALILSPLQFHITDDIVFEYNYVDENSTQFTNATESHTPEYITFDQTVPNTSITFNTFLGSFLAIASLAVMAGLAIGAEHFKRKK